MEQQNEGGKPKLDPEGQIAFLRGKGVAFERMGEADAMRYLSRESYLFSAYAYRTLFPRRVGGAHDGEYANLDFGDLVDLERLDRDLRAALLPLVLDTEHLAKARVLDEVARRPSEDGHSIVRDYMASLSPAERSRRAAEISRLRRDEYSGDLQRHYAAEMPIWVLLELSSFGTVADVYRFCTEPLGRPPHAARALLPQVCEGGAQRLRPLPLDNKIECRRLYQLALPLRFRLFPGARKAPGTRVPAGTGDGTRFAPPREHGCRRYTPAAHPTCENDREE